VTKRADEPIHHDDVERTVKGAVQRAAAATEIAERKAELEAKGVTVLEVKGYDKWGSTKLPKDRIGYGGQMWRISSDDHAKEPCHAVCVYAEYGTVYESYHCTDRKRHDPDGESKLKADVPGRRDEAAAVDQKREKQAERARFRRQVLLDAGREILTGRAPAKDKIIERVLDSFVTTEWYNGDTADEAIILLDLGTEDDAQWPDLVELYEQADGPNRTKILVALLLSRMISDASWSNVADDSEDFRSTLAFYRDLGRPIELSSEIKAAQELEKKAAEVDKVVAEAIAEGKAKGR